MVKLLKKYFDASEIKMYDLELTLVMFGEFLKIVFPLLKWYYRVQNMWFTR